MAEDEANVPPCRQFDMSAGAPMVKVRVTHIESLREIYIRPEALSKKWRQFTRDLDDYADRAESEAGGGPCRLTKADMFSSQPCLASVAQDGEPVFRRALIEGFVGERVLIHLLDIGSRCEVSPSSLWYLPSALASEARFAICCAVDFTSDVVVAAVDTAAVETLRKRVRNEVIMVLVSESKRPANQRRPRMGKRQLPDVKFEEPEESSSDYVIAIITNGVRWRYDDLIDGSSSSAKQPSYLSAAPPHPLWHHLLPSTHLEQPSFREVTVSSPIQPQIQLEYDETTPFEAPIPTTDKEGDLPQNDEGVTLEITSKAKSPTHRSTKKPSVHSPSHFHTSPSAHKSDGQLPKLSMGLFDTADAFGMEGFPSIPPHVSRVTIAHVVSPTEIYVQDEDQSLRRSQIETMLAHRYTKGGCAIGDHYLDVSGHPCCIMMVDDESKGGNLWARAVVVSMQKTSDSAKAIFVEVRLMDYGRTVRIPWTIRKERISRLFDDFRGPPLVYVLGLWGSSSNPSCTLNQCRQLASILKVGHVYHCRHSSVLDANNTIEAANVDLMNVVDDGREGESLSDLWASQVGWILPPKRNIRETTTKSESVSANTSRLVIDNRRQEETTPLNVTGLDRFRMEQNVKSQPETSSRSAGDVVNNISSTSHDHCQAEIGSEHPLRPYCIVSPKDAIAEASHTAQQNHMPKEDCRWKEEVPLNPNQFPPSDLRSVVSTVERSAVPPGLRPDAAPSFFYHQRGAKRSRSSGPSAQRHRPQTPSAQKSPKDKQQTDAAESQQTNSRRRRSRSGGRHRKRSQSRNSGITAAVQTQQRPSVQQQPLEQAAFQRNHFSNRSIRGTNRRLQGVWPAPTSQTYWNNRYIEQQQMKHRSENQNAPRLFSNSISAGGNRNVNGGRNNNAQSTDCVLPLAPTVQKLFDSVSKKPQRRIQEEPKKGVVGGVGQCDMDESMDGSPKTPFALSSINVSGRSALSGSAKRGLLNRYPPQHNGASIGGESGCPVNVIRK